MTNFTAALTTDLEVLATETRDTPLDAIVLGGGTAGITAARTLAEGEKLRVALFEAGSFQLLTHVTSTGLRFDPRASRAVQASFEYGPTLASGGNFGNLIGCLGGRGMFWNGAAPAYEGSDFAHWPIAESDLEEEFAWARRELHVTDTASSPSLLARVMERLNKAGIPAKPSPFAVDTRATRDGFVGGTVGNSVAALLESRVLSRQTQPLRVCVGAFASKILTDDKKTAATAVRVKRHSDGKEVDIRARVFVLAAGALESTRLALSSSLPDPSGLMGHFLADHIFCRAYYPAPHLYGDRPEAAMLLSRASGQTPFQREMHLPGNQIFSASESEAWAPDASPRYAVMVRSFAPTAPRYENALEATADDRPGGMKVTFTYSERDDALREEMIAGLEQTRAALDALPAPEVQRLPAGASHHEAGGLIMGDAETSSVTDEFGRVRGIPNVVCVDSATWPSLAATNPHLTIAAVARRQAKAIRANLT